ncbi:acyl carrier protein [Paenibacillus rhizoplanae]|uniref:acyl carrier protein n=1 Tax=Paenibacillus rhizoplanae TaxID=1917181 RepID=UPI0036190034
MSIFFDLGGNSLKLVQMQLKLQSMLNREIPIIELFRHSSVAAMVEFRKCFSGQVPGRDGAKSGGPRRQTVSSPADTPQMIMNIREETH